MRKYKEAINKEYEKDSICYYVSLEGKKPKEEDAGWKPVSFYEIIESDPLKDCSDSDILTVFNEYQKTLYLFNLEKENDDILRSRYYSFFCEIGKNLPNDFPCLIYADDKEIKDKEWESAECLGIEVHPQNKDYALAIERRFVNGRDSMIYGIRTPLGSNKTGIYLNARKLVDRWNKLGRTIYRSSCNKDSVFSCKLYKNIKEIKKGKNQNIVNSTCWLLMQELTSWVQLRIDRNITSMYTEPQEIAKWLIEDWKELE